MVGKTVVVTGASGFIAAHLVKILLERGYTVRGTVRNPDDPAKVGFLFDLPGAKERLKLYKAQLLEDGAFDSVIEDADGVFHTASPVLFSSIDPEKELIEPAVKGSLNVLQSASKVKSVKRVVLTSSNAAVSYSSKDRAGAVIDETWYSDESWCRETKQWYLVSKILAERAASEFAKEKNLDLVIINPAMVLGRMLQPSLNLSVEIIANYLNGKTEKISNYITGYVAVEDVAMAHVLAYEKPDAEGRYVLAEKAVSHRTIVDILRKFYPEYPLPTELAYDPKDELGSFSFSQEKPKKLGLTFKSFEQQLHDTVASLKEKGWI